MPGAPIALFDLDNTIVHSRIDFIGIRLAIIGRLIQTGGLVAVPPNPRERSIAEWLDLAVAHDPALGAELWQTVDDFERSGMVEGTVEDDARACLEALRDAGWRIAILTNNSLQSAEAALERFDLLNLPERVYARGVVGALKPNGAGVAQAHDDLGGGPTFVIGDGAIDGLAAMRASVGARFVAFRANLDDLRQKGVPVWAQVHALAEVPPLLIGEIGEGVRRA